MYTLNNSVFLFFLFCIGQLGLKAQEYIPFIQADSRWQVSINETQTVWGFDRMYEDYFGEPVEWEGQNYIQVMRHDFERADAPGGLEQYPQPFIAGEARVIGLVREEIEARKVYFRWADFNTPGQFQAEFLLYDFSLEVGDSFYDELVEAGPYTVSQIGLDQVIDSQDRRLWMLDNGTAIIEGVGSQFGPFEGVTALISGAFPSLYNYCRGDATACNVLLSSRRVTAPEVQILYPNPATDRLQLNRAMPGHQLLFRNMLGQQLTNISLDDNLINISRLPAGNLIYQLLDPMGQLIGVGRLVKH